MVNISREFHCKPEPVLLPIKDFSKFHYSKPGKWMRNNVDPIFNRNSYTLTDADVRASLMGLCDIIMEDVSRDLIDFSFKDSVEKWAFYMGDYTAEPEAVALIELITKCLEDAFEAMKNEMSSEFEYAHADVIPLALQINETREGAQIEKYIRELLSIF